MNLDDAIDLARRAHRGATDKAKQPYIEHPLRVMERVSAAGEAAQMAAVLHDVLEDTSITADDLLARGCPPEVVVAVECVSKPKSEAYAEFVHRIAESGDPIAILVKLADLADNSDEERLARLPGAEASRLRLKYREARTILVASGRVAAERYPDTWASLALG